jgi:uncharacterized membrane protein
MKSSHRIFLTELAAFAALTIPGWSAAQEPQDHLRKYHHYRLVDMGTFGGPSGGISNPSSPTLNRHGALVGVSDTAVADPYSPNCFLQECFVIQTWVWQSGVLNPLPALPGGASNFAASINDQGQITGESQNGALDPLTGWPRGEAVIWRKGEVRDLGTVGGNQSNANANNNRGQVVGAALNGTDDPFAGNFVASCIFYAPYGGCGTFAQMFLFAPAATETRAFLWTETEGMQDLGTLGGPDSSAWIINDRGQIAGESFTSYTANVSSGVPTVDPFRWDPELKKMRDLGGLGGTFGAPLSMNHHGDVVGSSNPPGDMTSHPFLWTEAEGMQDLGTFAGASGYGEALSLNDEREVVGHTSNPDPTTLVAFLWKNKVLTSLGTIGTGTCSVANSINSRGQIAGAAVDPAGGCSEELRGLYWDAGSSTPVDLNALLVPGTTMFVISGIVINDAGEIGCLGVDSGDTDAHACLLIPCDESHAGVENCDYSMVEASSEESDVSAPATKHPSSSVASP